MRGEHIGEDKWLKWVDNLPISQDQKDQLNKLSPKTYIGLAVELTKRAIKAIESSRKK